MTAAEAILSKVPVPAALSTAEWDAVPAAFRRRAFFSARVAEARALREMRDACARVASGGLSASDARLAIRKALDAAGYESPGTGALQDLRGERRLNLVLETNVRQARGWGQAVDGCSPGALAAFPCQELVRVRGRKVPRNWPERWKAAGGRLYAGRMVAPKGDPVWERISRFGNPYPPFDFNSGMGVRDVGRREAVRLGVIAADAPPPSVRPPAPPSEEPVPPDLEEFLR